MIRRLSIFSWCSPQRKKCVSETLSMQVFDVESKDYISMFCDSSSDWERKLLTIDNKYALCHPVFYRWRIHIHGSASSVKKTLPLISLVSIGPHDDMP